jgi:hypothetical protein
MIFEEASYLGDLPDEDTLGLKRIILLFLSWSKKFLDKSKNLITQI